MDLRSNHFIFCLGISLILPFIIKSLPVEESEEKKSWCSGNPADIFFLLDSSSSIWNVDYKIQLQFIADIVEEFPISPTETRVGIGIFSDYYRNIIHFDAFKDKENLKSAIRKIPQLYGNTLTGNALRHIRQYVFGKARNNVDKLLIVLTDGESRDKLKTKREAKRIKDDGVIVFTIGVGKKVNKKELEAIASKPKDEFVFTVASFDVLGNIRDSLAYKACKAPRDMPYCSAFMDTDVMFVYDAAGMGTKHSDHVTNFANNVIQKFGNMDEGVIRAGLISGDCHTTNFHLNTYTRKQDINTMLTEAQHLGLDSIVNEMHCNSFTEGRGGRMTARHVAVVFVDKSVAKEENLVREILDAKMKDIEIFVVAIGEVDDSLLQKLASSPTEDHIFRVNSYPELDKLADSYSQIFCNGIDNKT